jgi:hypothetical protein
VAEQQQIYKSEIERIWKAQFDSLSRKDEPQLTEEDEKRDVKEVKKVQTQPPLRRDHAPYSPAMSPMATEASVAPSPAFSRGSSVDPERELSLFPDGGSRILRIKRLVYSDARFHVVGGSRDHGIDQRQMAYRNHSRSGGDTRIRSQPPSHRRGIHPCRQPGAHRGPRQGQAHEEAVSAHNESDGFHSSQRIVPLDV